MSRRAAIYTRISHVDPRKDRDDPTRATERQARACRAFATAKGWDVVAVFTDEDRSASRAGVVREGLDDLRAAAARGELDVVIAWRLDRVGRRTVDVLSLVEELDTRGVKFASVEDAGVDTSGPSGELVLTIMAAIARHEARLMGLRIKAQRQATAEAGRPAAGGLRAFGYEADGLTVNEEEAELLREAARRALAGEPWRAIAEDWKARGIRTPTGGEWRPSHLSRALRSDRVRGLRIYRPTKRVTVTEGGEQRVKTVPDGEPEVWPAAWPAILDEDTSDALRGRHRRRERERGATHPLTGLLRCGECGTSMNHHRQRGQGRYRCVKGPALPGCGGVSVKASDVEELVWHAALGRSWRRDQAQDERLTRALTAAEEELTAARDRADELDHARWVAGTLPARTYDRQAPALHRLVAEHEERVAALREERRDQAGFWQELRAMAEHYETATEQERRRFLLRAVQRVDVDRARPGKWFQPERVLVTWTGGEQQGGEELVDAVTRSPWDPLLADADA